MAFFVMNVYITLGLIIAHWIKTSRRDHIADKHTQMYENMPYYCISSCLNKWLKKFIM